MHAKGEFGLGDAHCISRHGSRAAVRNDRLRQDASSHRTIDIDVLLTGFAGGRYFPAEQTAVRVVFDSPLDRVAFCAVARTQRRFETSKLGASAPMIPQGL